MHTFGAEEVFLDGFLAYDFTSEDLPWSSSTLFSIGRRPESENGGWIKYLSILFKSYGGSVYRTSLPASPTRFAISQPVGDMWYPTKLAIVLTQFQ